MKNEYRKRCLAPLFLSLALLTSSPVLAAETTAAGTEQPAGASGYDAVYVIDNSKSVWNQADARNEAFETITDLAVGTDVRIGAVYFAKDIYKSLELTSVEDKNGAGKVKDFLQMKETDNNNIDTNIGNALEHALSLFDDSDPSRQKIIVLFSDGINENAKGEASYKEAADKLTEEQVAILKEQNIPIYCVYLQKSRNDADYLKDLVNYFSDEKDYAADRFSTVTSDKIDTLSNTFSDVFYIIQEEVITAQEEKQNTEASTETGSEAGAEAGSKTGSEVGSEAGSEAGSEVNSEAGTESAPTATETKAEEAPAAVPTAYNSILDYLPFLSIPVLLILVAILFFLRKGKKTPKEGVTTFEKAQSDFREAKEHSDWSRADYDDECERLAVCKNELTKRLGSAAVPAEITALLAAASEMMEKAVPLLSTRDTLLSSALELMKNGKNSDTKALKSQSDELGKNAEALKAMAAEFAKVNAELEELIGKL